MTPAETVLLMLFEFVVAAASGALLHAMLVDARANRVRRDSEEAEHAPVLERVRRWQAATSGVPPVWARMAGHRVTARHAARRVWARLAGLLPARPPVAAAVPAALPAAPADTNVQAPPPPYNPAYRGSASLDVPFDVQIRVRNEWLHAQAAGRHLRAAANLEDTGLIIPVTSATGAGR